MNKKIYVVLYVHATANEVYDKVDVTCDYERAKQIYMGFRQLALDTARADEEEEHPVSIIECPYHFRAYDEQDKETYVVRIAVKEVV